MTNILSMKEWNFLVHFLEFLNRGGGLRGMRKRARMGCMSHSGGCDSAISRAVMPGKKRERMRLGHLEGGDAW